MNERLKILSFKKLSKEIHDAAMALNASIVEIEAIRLLPDFNKTEVIEAIAASDALLFTSPEAVYAIQAILAEVSLEHKKIYAVGSRLSAFFSKKGLTAVEGNNIAELSDIIVKAGHKQLAYFHGNRALNTVDRLIDQSAVNLVKVMVYRNELLYPKVVGQDDFQLFWYFSPSGVESFMKYNRFPNNALIAAIGSTTGSSIKNRNVFIASRPDALTLLNESVKHYRRYGNN